MNIVFDVKHKNENVHYAVGGENRTKAIISYLYSVGENSCNLIDYRARKVKSYKEETIKTDKTGLLEMEELMQKGYKTWWACSECGCESDEIQCFDYVPTDQYKCKECGYIGSIPFAD